MKAGALRLPPFESVNSVFMRYIAQGTFHILSHGAFGLTLHLTVNTPIEGGYTQFTPTPAFGEPVTSLVVKLSFVSDERVQIALSKQVALDTITRDEWQREIDIQTDVYKQTLAYLEPLCPAIVYSHVITPHTTEGNMLCDPLIQHSSANPLVRMFIQTLREMPHIHMGIIGMECIEHAYTMHDMIQANSGNLKLVELIKNVGRYMVLQLALQTGYSHNDFHGGNVLLTKQKGYFTGISVTPTLIDFGRARALSASVRSQINDWVQQGRYTDALALLCTPEVADKHVANISNRQFHWLCGNYRMNPTDRRELERYRQEMKRIFDVNISVEITVPWTSHEVTNAHIQTLIERRQSALDIAIQYMNERHTYDSNIPTLPLRGTI